MRTIAILISIALTIMSLQCFAESRLHKPNLIEICDQINKERSPAVFMLSPDKSISVGPIDMGTINVEKLVPRDEGFLIPTEYHLIVTSSKYVPDSLENNTLRTLVRKVRSTCPGKTEYSVSFIIDGSILVPGKMEYHPKLEFHDPNDEYSRQAKSLFDLKLTAFIVTPFATSEIDDKLHRQINEFFIGARTTVVLPIKNTGNEVLSIKGFKSDTVRFPEIKVKSTDCANHGLQPGASCSVALVKSSPHPLTPEKIYSLHIDSNLQTGNMRFEFWIQTSDRVVGELKN